MNKKISNFESLNASDINRNLTYVSAIQKQSDGSFKNVNIPISVLSGLWNTDLQASLANAPVTASGTVEIDAELIHEAALSAVENALNDAQAAVDAAIEAANTLVGQVNTGNTDTQRLIEQAQDLLREKINEATEQVADIHNKYNLYFGDNGVVEQAINDANADLANASDILHNAEQTLQDLADGNITSESLHTIEREVDGLKTMWGITGTYVGTDENGKATVANKVLEYVDLVLGRKEFKMTNADGEKQKVTTFKQLLDVVDGTLSTSLTNANVAKQKLTEVGSKYDAINGRLEEFVKTSDLSDPEYPLLKAAVRTMTDSLIEDLVKEVLMEVKNTLTFPQGSPYNTIKTFTIKNSNPIQPYSIDKDIDYWLRWDNSTGDNPVVLHYAIALVGENETLNLNDPNLEWKTLTTNAINSHTVVEYDENGQLVDDNYKRYLLIKYSGYKSGLSALNEDCTVVLQSDKYLAMASIQTGIALIILSALKQSDDWGQTLARLEVSDEHIQGVVARFLNLPEQNPNFDASAIKQTATDITQTVLNYLKNSNGSYRTLESEIKSTKDDINLSVLDATTNSVYIFKNGATESNFNLTQPYSVDYQDNTIEFEQRIRSCELTPSHTYMIKCTAISEIYYRLDTEPRSMSKDSFDLVSDWSIYNDPFLHFVKVTNPLSFQIHIPNESDKKYLSFYITIQRNPNSTNTPKDYMSEYEVEILETVGSQMANFKVTSDSIESLINKDNGQNGNALVLAIYRKLCKAGGETTTIGEVGYGFLNQAQVDASAEKICKTLMRINTGDDSTNPIVSQSELKQTVEEINANVNKVGYYALTGVLYTANDITTPISNEITVNNENQKAGPLYKLKCNMYNSLGKIGDYNYKNIFLGPGEHENDNLALIAFNIKNVDYNKEDDITLFINNLNKYRIYRAWYITTDTSYSNITNLILSHHELYPNNLVYDREDNTKNKSLPTLSVKTIGKSNSYWVFLQLQIYIQDKWQLATSSNLTQDNLELKVAIPNSTQVGQLSVSSDQIKSQVSDWESDWKNDGTGRKYESLKTSVINQTSNEISSTVATEINGQLAGYSTVQQTKDLIASTVGGSGYNICTESDFENRSSWMNNLNSDSQFIKRIINTTTNEIEALNIKNNDILYNPKQNNFEKSIGNSLGIKVVKPNGNVYGGYYKWIRNLKPNYYYTISFYAKLPVNHNYDRGKDFEVLIGLDNSGTVTLVNGYNIVAIDVSKTYSENDNRSLKKGTYTDNDNPINSLTDSEGKTIYVNTPGTTYHGYENIFSFSNNNSIVKNYIDTVYGSDTSIKHNPNILNGLGFQENTYAWFKIWFTVKTDDMLTESKNDKCLYFYFVPTDNNYADNVWVEIAKPMIAPGLIPVLWTNVLDTYSMIAQTQNQIEASVNKVRSDLEWAGIKIDANNPENAKIVLKADTLQGEIGSAVFTGDVRAKSLMVTQTLNNTKGSINLMLYSPNNLNLTNEQFKRVFGISENLTTASRAEYETKYIGTPLLVATVATSDDTKQYVTNLTDITPVSSSSTIKYYFLIKADPVVDFNSKFYFPTSMSINGTAYVNEINNNTNLYYLTKDKISVVCTCYKNGIALNNSWNLVSIPVNNLNLNTYFSPSSNTVFDGKTVLSSKSQLVFPFNELLGINDSILMYKSTNTQSQYLLDNDRFTLNSNDTVAFNAQNIYSYSNRDNIIFKLVGSLNCKGFRYLNSSNKIETTTTTIYKFHVYKGITNGILPNNYYVVYAISNPNNTFKILYLNLGDCVSLYKSFKNEQNSNNTSYNINSVRQAGKKFADAYLKIFTNSNNQQQYSTGKVRYTVSNDSGPYNFEISGENKSVFHKQYSDEIDIVLEDGYDIATTYSSYTVQN